MIGSQRCSRVDEVMHPSLALPSIRRGGKRNAMTHMSNETALRERYSVMETEALSTLWRDEERMPWAEAILREELVARGVPAAQLDDIASRREQIARDAPPKLRDTLFGWGVIGRAMTLFVAMAAAQIAGRLFGTRGAIAAAFLVFAVYTTALVVRVSQQMKQPSGVLGGFAMTWQCIEAVFITAALGVVGLFVVRG